MSAQSMAHFFLKSLFAQRRQRRSEALISVLHSSCINTTLHLPLLNEERTNVVRIFGYAEMVVTRYSDVDFKRHFRLQRGTFEILCQHLNQIEERPAVHLREKEKISLEKQLLITLWVLGNPECPRSAADRFGVAESKVYTCYKDMCKVISKNLMSAFIVWPISSEERTKAIIDRFNEFNGVPNCIGCTDGCHIPIKGPRFKREDYINRKGYASIILQAVCDSEYLFTDIYVGWPGSVHDARVLRNSPLYEDATINRDAVFPGGTYILGDQAYPLQTWLLTKYRDNGALTQIETNFNKNMSAKRQRIEQTFALLKGRFRKLKVMMDIDRVVDIPDIVSAACVLHNICCLNEDDIMQFLDAEDQQPQNIDMENIFRNEATAIQKRNAVALLMF